jgi:hypothetical protein
MFIYPNKHKRVRTYLEIISHLPVFRKKVAYTTIAE